MDRAWPQRWRSGWSTLPTCSRATTTTTATSTALNTCWRCWSRSCAPRRRPLAPPPIPSPWATPSYFSRKVISRELRIKEVNIDSSSQIIVVIYRVRAYVRVEVAVLCLTLCSLLYSICFSWHFFFIFTASEHNWSFFFLFSLSRSRLFFSIVVQSNIVYIKCWIWRFFRKNTRN